MIIKFNCSIKDFNELYYEKDPSYFEERILFILNVIEENVNPEINENNYFSFNENNCFYISILHLEKILKDIQIKNKLLDNNIVMQLLNHCRSVYNIGFLINKLQLI